MQVTADVGQLDELGETAFARGLQLAHGRALPAVRPHREPGHLHGGGHHGFASLTLGAIGVVFGDIGTSPLYALKATVLATEGGLPNHGTEKAIVAFLLSLSNKRTRQRFRPTPILAGLQHEAHSPGFSIGTLAPDFQQRGRFLAMWKRDESVKPAAPTASSPAAAPSSPAATAPTASEPRAQLGRDMIKTSGTSRRRRALEITPQQPAWPG